MDTIERTQWAIIEANFSSNVESQAQEILNAIVADYTGYVDRENIMSMGVTHTDGVGALWLEVTVAGNGTYWYTNQREDLINARWSTAAVENIERIPNNFKR